VEINTRSNVSTYLPLTLTSLTISSAERNQRESPLLRLPGELRNRIYGYALGRMRFFINGSRWYGKLEADAEGPELSLHYFFALIQVCRQVYSEAHLLPYKLNIIHDRVSNQWFPEILNSDQRNAIRTIVFQMEDMEMTEEELTGRPTDKYAALEEVFLDCYGSSSNLEGFAWALKGVEYWTARKGLTIRYENFQDVYTYRGRETDTHVEFTRAGTTRKFRRKALES
jgi:hypothetical protein